MWRKNSGPLQSTLVRSGATLSMWSCPRGTSTLDVRARVDQGDQGGPGQVTARATAKGASLSPSSASPRPAGARHPRTTGYHGNALIPKPPPPLWWHLKKKPERSPESSVAGRRLQRASSFVNNARGDGLASVPGTRVPILGQWSPACGGIFSRPLVLPGNCSLLYVLVRDCCSSFFLSPDLRATNWWEMM